jgi:hypothetical protein
VGRESLLYPATKRRSRWDGYGTMTSSGLLPPLMP